MKTTYFCISSMDCKEPHKEKRKKFNYFFVIVVKVVKVVKGEHYKGSAKVRAQI
jgi:hypothetical protein